MTEVKGNTAVPQGGDRDRVAMLSLKADGTPDQNNPELIGNKEFALAATKEQFAQQAVSAVDQAKRPEVLPAAGAAETLEVQDPAIEELKAAHDKAAAAAEKAAESTVEALFAGDADQPAATKTATPTTATKASASK